MSRYRKFYSTITWLQQELIKQLDDQISYISY